MHDHDPPRAVPVLPEPHRTGSDAACLFRQPPSMRDAQGVVRRVGVEVEFMGISALAAAGALAAGLGGTCREEDPHAFHILDSAIGRLSVELDLR